MTRSAGALARQLVAGVADDPGARLRLLSDLYEPRTGDGVQLPFRRAALSFMRWQLRRGLLMPATAPTPGSAWWRAVNAALLQDTAEARLRADGVDGGGSPGPSVAAMLRFVASPSPARWYRAHNMSVVSAYLSHSDLAAAEGRVERFFINVVLMRVMYAHAMVAAPREALGPLAALGPVVGDPRLGFTGIFLSLSRVLPDSYPLGEDVEPYLLAERRLGRVIDMSLIQPRLRFLYDWSATQLELPSLAELWLDGVPTYAWDPDDRTVWSGARDRRRRNRRVTG